MSSDFAQALLLFALVLGGLFSLFLLMVNLQYQVHRRRRIRLREIARTLGLDYNDDAGDLEEPASGFRRKLRLRSAAWSITGRFKEHEVLLRPTMDNEPEDYAVYYGLRGSDGAWSGLHRPRSPLHDEEVEMILNNFLAAGPDAESPQKN